jgi:hypothetical protein
MRNAGELRRVKEYSALTSDKTVPTNSIMELADYTRFNYTPATPAKFLFHFGCIYTLSPGLSRTIIRTEGHINDG